MRNETGERSGAKDSVGFVGTHAVTEVQMAEMDATQKCVWEVGQGGGGGDSGAAAHCTLSFSEMTVIYYRSFSDLLTERSPTVTPADLRLPVLHSGLNQSTHYTQRSSWTLSTLDRACPPALSNSVFPSIISVWAVIKRFSCYFYSSLCVVAWLLVRKI